MNSVLTYALSATAVVAVATGFELLRRQGKKIMGTLEDIQASLASSLGTIGSSLLTITAQEKTLHDELAAALAAGQAPDPATIAKLQALTAQAADVAAQASAVAAANAPPATIPDPAPAPANPPANDPAPPPTT